MTALANDPPPPPADPPPPPPKNPTHPPDTRPPNRKNATPEANTGSPWPSRPGGPSGPGGPTAPPKSNTELLDDIDGTLVALLVMSYFGPAEQGTAAAAEQAAAAEVLLFRLRMARRAVADLRAAFESPARQSPQLRPSGGPVNVPGSMLRGPGEEGCADGAVSAAFRLPDTRLPLAFEPGERRLYGRVGDPS
ncbi:hypothetical protein ACFQS1_14905 [Paractinoplanes rhizophilus]|uniref:Uncharacterized protein n=1 Tax=Paractinoplanes rhizophilus TaxID=1416877 RepID=A0ABW2HT69_9ACTN